MIMAKVEVETEEVLLENELQQVVGGIRVRCTRCDHEVDVFGTSDQSVRRGCIMLREECPQGEENFYSAE
jgi:ribosomal protein S27E